MNVTKLRGYTILTMRNQIMPKILKKKIFDYRHQQHDTVEVIVKKFKRKSKSATFQTKIKKKIKMMEKKIV